MQRGVDLRALGKLLEFRSFFVSVIALGLGAGACLLGLGNEPFGSAVPELSVPGEVHGSGFGAGGLTALHTINKAILLSCWKKLNRAICRF